MTRNFATVGAVYEDGVTLIFDGEENPTDKHYLCNTSVEFHAGDRVRIVECDGTYIVEYVVGPPGSGGGGGLPPGGAAKSVLQKKTAADDDVQWGTVDASVGGLPLGGEENDVLVKSSILSYQTKWVREAPLAAAVLDSYNSSVVKAHKIEFRYAQSKFWARYDGGSWVQFN